MGSTSQLAVELVSEGQPLPFGRHDVTLKGGDGMNGLLPCKRVMCVIMAMFAALGILWGVMATLQAAASAQVSLEESLSPNGESVVGPANWECVPEITLTLAAYQAWFGLDSHIKPPYISTDTTVISGHITAALAQGIDGFVVDWYGPGAGVLNDPDRRFIDEATLKLVQQSEGRDFYVALTYDEGTVSATETLTTAYTTRVISDLLYARRYFTMPAYLHVLGHPALFVFPYETVDPYIDWAQVRSQLGITVTLFDKDPNPGDPVHDAQFDGFFAWVQPTASQWLTDGTEWGEGYLTWFYNTMATPTYTNKITIGGVWPGFDDSLASWGSGRYMWRRCGQTWCDTWSIAAQYSPPIVMIDTWNDFEEGTDIEFGTGECLTPSREKCAPPGGGQVVYTHTLANTGKFTDTFNLKTRSSSAWPTIMSLTSITLVGHASTTVAITLTVPKAVSVGTQDTLVVTATSQLSPSVHSSVLNTTTACGCFLPIALKDYTWRFIEISGPTEVHSWIADVNGVWTGFPLEEVTVRLYAQEGNKYWCIQPSRAADVSSDHWTAEGQFGVTTYGVFAVVAEGSGDQLPACDAPPGQNYITATNEGQFRAYIRPYVYLGDSRSISPRFVISRVE
jgi:hypothetical protein